MTDPDLGAYDYVVINSSAGKDSQAMLGVVVELAREKNLPLTKLVVVHADLGRVEWPGTKELAEEHAAHYGLRFEVVRHVKGTLIEGVRARAAAQKAKGKKAPPWFSAAQRWCTAGYKRGPIRTLFTRLVREFHQRLGQRGKRRQRCRILNCMGMRAEESCKRAKLEPFEFCEDASNGLRHVDDWLPIHGWSTEQVWERIRAEGTTPHPAYALGMPRVSCVLCCMAPRSALMVGGKHNRALLDEYVALEQETGYVFRVGLPLVEIRDALDRGEEPEPVQSWAM